METATDFAKYLTKFFTEYLVGERGASSHTIRSYRDTFTLVLTYMDKVRHIAADRLTLTHFYRETILDFLDWLQKERRCANSTRNQRLAALHSFFAYMQYEDVKHLDQWQNILSIRVKKQGEKSYILKCDCIVHIPSIVAKKKELVAGGIYSCPCGTQMNIKNDLSFSKWTIVKTKPQKPVATPSTE